MTRFRYVKALMLTFRNESGGVALILVIWIMVMLVALVVEFSYSMRTEINITRNFKEEEEAYQLALAGIEKAKMEILAVNDLRKMYIDENNQLIFNPDEDKPERRGDLGRGSFEYTITDDDGKLNLNTASASQLRYVFLGSGVDTDDVDTIVDSILDWIDKNDLHRLNGAEEDYYRSLDRPYSCKDGFFSTVGELLMVKGMKPEILFGSKDRKNEDEQSYAGVAQYFTVNGSNIININTAPPVVLEAVLGPAVAENILAQRETGPVQRPVGGGKVSSEIFTILSTGRNADGSVRRSVAAVVQRKADNMKVLYWNDNIV